MLVAYPWLINKFQAMNSISEKENSQGARIGFSLYYDFWHHEILGVEGVLLQVVDC